MSNFNPVSVQYRQNGKSCRQPCELVYSSVSKCSTCYTNTCVGKKCEKADVCCGDAKIAAIAAALFAGLIFFGGSENGSGSAY